MRTIRKILSVIMICAFLGIVAEASALPDPVILPFAAPGVFLNIPDPAHGGFRDAILVDGVPMGFRYDDFWSYSALLLDAVQDANFIPTSFGDYQFATGTGGLDALLFTAAVGQSNQGIGPSGTHNLEDPTLNPGGSAIAFDGWWGQDDQDDDGTADNVNGPVTVGQVVDYLHDFNPFNNIPVFYLDLNQTGGNPDLLFSGRVFLVDADNDQGGGIVHEWALDLTDQAGDGVYDKLSKAIALGSISATGISGTNYSVNHNLGSGKPDYIAFAPTMDLAMFDRDDWFVAEFHMGEANDGNPFGDLNNGFEEIFLTGNVFAGSVPIPEPTTMFLLCSGLIGLAGLNRKFRKR